MGLLSKLRLQPAEKENIYNPDHFRDYRLHDLFHLVTHVPVSTAPPSPTLCMTPTQTAAYERWMTLVMIVETAPCIEADERIRPEISKPIRAVAEAIQFASGPIVSVPRLKMGQVHDYGQFLKKLAFNYEKKGAPQDMQLPRYVPERGDRKIVSIFTKNSDRERQAMGRELGRVLRTFVENIDGMFDQQRRAQALYIHTGHMPEGPQAAGFQPF